MTGERFSPRSSKMPQMRMSLSACCSSDADQILGRFAAADDDGAALHDAVARPVANAVGGQEARAKQEERGKQEPDDVQV